MQDNPRARAIPAIIVMLLLGGSLFARDVVTEVIVENDTLHQSETCIAVDQQADSILMAAWNAEDPSPDISYSIGWGFSFDGGTSWSTGLLEPVDSIHVNGGDPSCAFDESGYVYCCYVAYRMYPPPPSSQLYVARTDIFDADWDYFYVDQGAKGTDRPYMTIDNTGGDFNDRIYTLWVGKWGGDLPAPKYDYMTIWRNYSTDHGESWSAGDSLRTVCRLDTIKPSGLNSPIPVVGNDGTLYAAWTAHYADNTFDIEIKRSTNGGISFVSCTSITDLNGVETP